MRSIKITTLSLLVLAAFPLALSAQTYDSSGDGMLNGTYYLRQVFYVPTSSGTDYANIQGTITFNGGGSYTFSGSLVDLANGNLPSFTASGSYTISASGEGFISAISPEVPNTDQIVGLVSHGIFIGSTTENTIGYNDLFIAAPIGPLGSTSPTATNATLKGSYQVAYMDPSYFPTSIALPGGDALFSMNPDGNGNIGTINVTGYVGTNTSASTETLTGVTYSFTNGAAQLNFGGSNTALVQGTELLYISPDGNFIFGGNFNGFDMFVGVRNATSNPSNYAALYYQAGLDLDQAAVADEEWGLDSYYGAINAFVDQSGNNDILGHQRLNSLGSTDETYLDNYALNGDGSSDDTFFLQHYFSSSDGTIRVGYGTGPSQGYPVLSLNVALQAPTFSGSGVYLSPVGMVNAASSSPFTAQLSPGEYLSLYGSNLAPSAAAATSLPLPENLNGVTVTINYVPAHLNFVSPGQINLVVPFVTTQTVAQIQVNNNGTNSNTITQFVGATSAGVFTYDPAGGFGQAAALDITNGYALVSPSTPAQIGDVIAVFVAGLGTVNGNPADGAAGPSNPTDATTNTIDVYIDDTADKSTQATVAFAGLAPGFAGLYQINFTVPAGVASGDTALEIVGPDSDTTESGFPVGTPEADATPAARLKSARQHRLIHHHRMLARPATITRNQQ
jgi:uncharacterized protein (TIGR03437 family)